MRLALLLASTAAATLASGANATVTRQTQPDSAAPQASPRHAAPVQGAEAAGAVVDGQAQSDDTAVTQDIVVTAQKRSERLRDVPVSITAVSGEQLAKQRIESPADLERIAPGFTYRLSQNGTPVFSIRGIGYYSESVAVAPAVTIYTDQIPLTYARMTPGAALDLERVEVLKGPQGTLFGQNSTGGAVNYIAAKPTSTFTGGFDGSYGRFNQADFGGFISGPITDTLKFRLAVRSEQRGDWQHSTTRDASIGQRDFLVGRFLLDWHPVDSVRIELNANGWRDRSEAQIGQAVGYLPLNPGNGSTPQVIGIRDALLAYPYFRGRSNRAADWDAGVDYRKNDKFYQFASRAEIDLTDDVQFVSITAYSNLDTFGPTDGDGTYLPNFRVRQFGQIKSFSQEARVEGSTGPVKWVIGGAYQKDKTEEVQRNQVIGSNAELAGVFYSNLDLYNNQNVRDLSAFGGVDVKLTSNLTVQGSVRYTDENRDFAGCVADGGGALGFRIAPIFPPGAVAEFACATFLPNNTIGEYRTSLDQDNLAWRGSLNWKAAQDVLVYANVTKGYKAGTFGTLPGVVFAQFTPVPQESVLAYEAGIKATTPSRAIDVSAAAFYYDYRDKQLQGFLVVPPFGNLPGLVSIPKSRIAGAEINLTLKPIDQVRITLGGTYVASKVTGSAFVSSPFGAPIDAKGEAFPATPKWQLQGDVEYNAPLASSKTFYVGGNVNWRSGTTASFGSGTGGPGTEDFFRIPGYALLDLRAGIEIEGRYRFGIWGRNVTGTKYWNNVTHIYDTFTRITGMPATYGITASTRF